MERTKPILQHKVAFYFLYYVENVDCYFVAGYRTSGSIGWEILENGVGIQTIYHCHAHSVCGNWKGIHDHRRCSHGSSLHTDTLYEWL